MLLLAFTVNQRKCTDIQELRTVNGQKYVPLIVKLAKNLIFNVQKTLQIEIIQSIDCCSTATNTHAICYHIDNAFFIQCEKSLKLI